MEKHGRVKRFFYKKREKIRGFFIFLVILSGIIPTATLSLSYPETVSGNSGQSEDFIISDDLEYNGVSIFEKYRLPEEEIPDGAHKVLKTTLGAAKWMDSQAVCQALAAGNLAGVAAGLDNDFQRVLPEGSAVPEIVETLRQAGALNAQMTGSGSAVFGLFRDREAAEAAAAALQADYPRTFCVSQV